jgi:hypothetical protein
MTPAEQQPLLDRLRDILLATIDYSLQKKDLLTRKEEREPLEQHYARMRTRLLNAFKARKLDALQRLLRELTIIIRVQRDQGYGKYIKEKTGYDIDIFAEVPERTDPNDDGELISSEELKLLSVPPAQPPGEASKVLKVAISYLDTTGRKTIIKIKEDHEADEFKKEPEPIPVIPDADRPELERRYKVALVAVAYTMEIHATHKKILGMDPIGEYHRHLLRKADRDYAAGRLDGLQWIFDNMVKRSWIFGRKKFNDYIKENAGFDVDIHAGVPERVDIILKRGKILTEEESHEVFIMLAMMRETQDPDQQRAELLKKLWDEYRSWKGKRRPEFSPFRNELLRLRSPSGERSIRMAEYGADRHSANTDVDVSCRNWGCSICIFYGTDLDINVRWKDEDTIEIESARGEILNSKLTELSRGGEAIRVEYIER